MGPQVLGANMSVSGGTPPAPPPGGWIVDQGMSNSFQQCGPNGSATIPYLGITASAEECQAKCVALKDCTSFSWDSSSTAGVWSKRCFGRIDGVWAPQPVSSVVSGCNALKLASCKPPAPPMRVFAHCARRTSGATIAFAFATLAPLNHVVTPDGSSSDDMVTLQFPGVTNMTVYSFTQNDPSADWVLLNGHNITAPLDVLNGLAVNGDSVTVPMGVVGFVEALFPSSESFPACA